MLRPSAIIPSSVPVESGEFRGWETIPAEPFENNIGPFFHRRDGEKGALCAMRAVRKSTNALGLVHGGCLLSLADHCLFLTAVTATGGAEVITVSLNGDFLGSARDGDLIEARGEVVKAGRSLIFVRGILSVGDRPVLNASATMMRLTGRG